MNESPTPRLSIIIATWQAAPALENCLRSIIDQDFGSWEVVIADGASTDGTVEIIRRFEKHIAWWQSKKDHGIADAWNQAIGRARGEYVAFLGADDAWSSRSSLSTIFNTIGDRQYDLVTGRAVFIDSKGRRFESGGAWEFDKIERRITICHPGCLHRRDLFSRFGMFDTRYRISADYEFLLRLPRTIRTLHIGETLVEIADGGISRRNRWLALQERYRAQAQCPRIGRFRAGLNLVDKLWRIPVAKALGIPN